MSKSLKSIIFWNAISQFGNSGISFISTIILARLLTPDDFGIIGIVSIFIAFSQMMIDSQMGGALLRKEEVKAIDYSTLFWYNLIVSCFLYLILFFIAPLVAEIYEKPVLTAVVRLISLSIIIYAFRITQRIILIREFKFHTLAIINIISGVVALIIAIIIAVNGGRYWALVIMPIVSAFCSVILMFYYNRFIPSAEFSQESFKYQFKFGINLLGAESVIIIANNISSNIIAKLASLSFVGYFTQSSRITNFVQGSFTGILDQSVYPYLSKLKDIDKIEPVYKKIMWLVAGTGIICSFCFVAGSNVLIPFILGKEWLPAIPIFKILSFSILPCLLQALSRNLIKTIGNTKIILHIESLKSFVLICSLIIAGIFNAYAIIWTYVAVQFISCLLWMVIAKSVIIKYQGENE